MSQTSGDDADYSSDNSDMNTDYKFWSRGLDRHYIGDYSFAAIKGNSTEDYSEVVVGPEATFVGVFDGHGGHHTSKYVSKNIFGNIMSCIQKHSTLSKEVLKEAFIKTEANWVTKLPEEFKDQELTAALSSGSSCLVGILWKASLYVANVGRTGSIMVQRPEGSGKVTIQLLTSIEGESVKSSIGDVHKKYRKITFMGKNIFVSKTPEKAPLDPFLVELPISPFNGEKFIIFGSSGFWKLMGVEDAAKLVVGLPWKGIAAILIKEALVKAAEKMGKTYEDVLSKDHDDITVIVLYFNKNLEVRNMQEEQMSVRVGGSFFSALENIRQE